MLPNFIHRSIIGGRSKLDKWLKFNRCALCTKISKHAPWCESCLGDFPSWAGQRLQIKHLDNVSVAYRYEYPLDRLIQHAKFKSNYTLIQSLSKLMPLPTLSGMQTMIYPVPVTKRRLLQRGFNQSRVLAEYIKSLTAIDIDEVSIHKLAGRSDQSRLSARERKRNAKDLFRGKFGAPVAEHAIIVDDVITTGATISALAKLLRANGAKRVDGIALAGVP